MAITAENTVAPEAKIVPVGGMTVDYPVAASTVIYRWSFVGLNATGYLTSHVTPTLALAASGAAPNGTRFVGIATEAIASQTADGDATCKVQIDGYFEYTMTSPTTIDVVDVGTPVFMADNSTLTRTARTGPCCGYIVQMAGTGRAVVKLDPFLAVDTAKLITVTSPALDLTTVSFKVLLVHETQNPTGLLLATCVAYCTSTILSSDADGVITIQHTADTSTGMTLTVSDNSAVGDLIMGLARSMWNPASATDDAIVIIPAGVQVNAEVTTAANQGTSDNSDVIVCATFLRV